MVSVDRALQIILCAKYQLKSEVIPIVDALGRVVARDITSDFNVPPFNNSAMDGYAIRSKDTLNASPALPVALKVIGESRAGGFNCTVKITNGTAVKIMTGAQIPCGADAVVMREDTALKDGIVYINNPVNKHDFIRFSGEDVKTGKTVLKKGGILKPSDIGIVASIRKNCVDVYKKPKIAILCTGDELVDISDGSEAGGIISSNLYALSAAISEAGGEAIPIGVVKDDKKALFEKVKVGLKYDFFITTGGISVGDYDFVREVLESAGAKNEIFKVSMRPGKPFSYFTRGETKIFALPGNPVSCLVAFELFVRPAILKAVGLANIHRRKVDATLMEEIKKSKEFTFFIRGIVKKEKEGYYVKTTGAQGSGILKSMSLANGLIVAQTGKELLKKGDAVKVIIIDESFERTKSF